MSKKLFISQVRFYETPGTSTLQDGRKAQPKGNFSAGIAVADRLNGDDELVGSFDIEDQRPIKVGFITFRKKFKTKEEAEAFVEAKESKFKVGNYLDPNKWHWGRADEELTNIYRESRGTIAFNATVHIVKHGTSEMPLSPEQLLAADAEQMQYKGKVTEPI